jgi:glycogen debranching enzyme
MILRFLVTLLLLSACLTKCTPENTSILPYIQLNEDQNKKFTYTNKKSGFYYGNTHNYNLTDEEGWTVNKIHYLQDYRLFSGSKAIEPDSLLTFDYSPFSAIRRYSFGLVETFTILDSLNALVWEYDFPRQAKNLIFKPILPRELLDKDLRLSLQNKRIIIAPDEPFADKLRKDTLWMGFTINFKNKSKTIVICALEKNEQAVNTVLNSLSTEYPDFINQRKSRMENILTQNSVVTNIPDITNALAWAQLSLDALKTQQDGPGIWAGLPLFNNYLGRDTFISFCGALLLSGQFTQARTVLLAFSKYQLNKLEDPWYGRISNQMTKKELMYNTADVTWWFIRAVYEYLLFSGDKAFAQKIFPVIKRAIDGALRFRVDELFFLVHQDTETWMDAKNPDGAWSPRGNRAVEIQALWYTALQIGSEIAKMNNQHNIADYWQAISSTLRENFSRHFWNTYRQEIYDHINPDGSKDRKFRPNQIFSVTVPNLLGIEPLIKKDLQATISSTVVQKLAYPYGVGSLEQGDKDFHPWLQYEPYYIKESAYHNGMVWTWLAGPLISSLIKFKRENLAYQLFQNQSYQILEWDAIGSYAQMLDAIPRPGQAEPRLSGSVSQASSLAEFVRNFYQDFIGYYPNALMRQVVFMPDIPDQLSYISVSLPYANNQLNFEYNKNHDTHRFIIHSPGGIKKLNGILYFPGYEEAIFQFDENRQKIVFDFVIDERKSYKTYTTLDWYFAQPELNENRTLDLPVSN